MEKPASRKNLEIELEAPKSVPFITELAVGY